MQGYFDLGPKHPVFVDVFVIDPIHEASPSKQTTRDLRILVNEFRNDRGDGIAMNKRGLRRLPYCLSTYFAKSAKALSTG
jgi:hypothetical protein